MEKPIILISGASGNVGLETINALLPKDVLEKFQLRLGVKNLNSRGSMEIQERFQNLNNIVEMDLTKPETLDNALKGVERVFLILPNSQRREIMGKNAIAACKRAGVKFVLLGSMVGADTKQTLFARQFRAVEEELESSGLPWCILRFAFFQENLLDYSEFIQNGEFPMRLQEGKISPIAIRDIGEVAAKILMGNIEDHTNKVYLLTGPELFSGPEIAKLMTEVFGKQINYRSPSPDEVKSTLESFGIQPWQQDGYLEFFDVIASNKVALVSPHLNKLLERPPTTLRDMLEMHKDLLV